MTGLELSLSDNKGNLLIAIAETMAILFEYPTEQITLETSMDDIDLWDSIQHLNLILMLEEKYGVDFSPKEIERMSSVQLIISMLQNKGV